MFYNANSKRNACHVILEFTAVTSKHIQRKHDEVKLWFSVSDRETTASQMRAVNEVGQHCLF